MSRGATSPLLHFLRNLGAQENFKHVPDTDLLRRFTADRDEAAFVGMIRRHGATVLQVCRSLLADHADAEDAFQATFLVLARQANAIRKKGSLASWLYGVAFRICLKARAARTVRQHHETQGGQASLVRRVAAAPEVDELTWREAQWIVHDELARLPEKYRAPLVLCYLEGKRQDEAERLLGWPAGKLRSMLERARQRLRTHLVRRGLGPGAVLVAAAGQALSAPLPCPLPANTVRAAASVALRPGTAGGVSTTVLALSEAVIQTMPLRKSKFAVCGLLLVALAGLAVGFAWPALAEEPEPAQVTAAASAGPAIQLRQAALPSRVNGIKARASSWWDQHGPDSAFDGDRNTMWNAGNYAPQWIEGDLGEPRQLASIWLIACQLPDGHTTHEVWVSDEPVGGAHARAGMVLTFPAPLAGAPGQVPGSPLRSRRPGRDGMAFREMVLPDGLSEQGIADDAPGPNGNGDDRTRAKLVHTFQGHTKSGQTLQFHFPTGMRARYVHIRTTQSPSWIAWVEVELRAVTRGQSD
jgi:RNA polymerase sigma factor (sigma-70 family)